MMYIRFGVFSFIYFLFFKKKEKAFSVNLGEKMEGWGRGKIEKRKEKKKKIIIIINLGCVCMWKKKKHTVFFNWFVVETFFLYIYNNY